MGRSCRDLFGSDVGDSEGREGVRMSSAVSIDRWLGARGGSFRETGADATQAVPVVVIGGGLTGMSVAARLAARGIGTMVVEAHRSVGGCAGYFRRRGFAFDVGATTLVDYRPGGVGGELIREIGLPDGLLEHLPGYIGWLGRERFALHADAGLWEAERRRVFGTTPGHARLWSLLDRLARAFWRASRNGARMPIRNFADVRDSARALAMADWPLLRYLNWTVEDALRWAGLVEDGKLRGFLSMVVQDTVHSELARAPLVNSALGITIRGAGLSRPRGGMHGFWRAFEERAAELGVTVLRSTAVVGVRGEGAGFLVSTTRGVLKARAAVSTLPIWDTAAIGTDEVREALTPWCRRDAGSLGGAVLMTMGVPEEEVGGHAMTHHQFLPEPGAPLGDGNNSFLSISSGGDEWSAPAGHRAVMMTTHVELDRWEGLTESEHDAMKLVTGDRLLAIARRAYPRLGERASWLAVASPRTYARFTRRHRGAVGGIRLTLSNSNQRAVPHEIGVPGFWVCGDTTWPGLGTVACAMNSGLVAKSVMGFLARQGAVPPRHRLTSASSRNDNGPRTVRGPLRDSLIAEPVRSP